MGDSGFFAQLHSPLDGPIGDFNKHGALPPTAWGGAGPMAGPGGAFNASGGALLGNVGPYDQDPSFSSELAYLNIPCARNIFM